MSEAVYSWFWQPPLEGQPGLMMIVDNHPGPHQTGIPMVVEDLKTILEEIEGQLPIEIALFQMRIYSRTVLEEWFEIVLDANTRRFYAKKPEFSQGQLRQLWEARLDS